MKLECYELKAGENLTTFEFVSEGSKGRISKLIQFSPTNLKGVFNLAFGDKDAAGEIDDLAISNNGDSEKVLATVVVAVYAFTDKHSDAWVYATGSTKSRTRLYQMGISKYSELAGDDYFIFGQLQSEWKPFEKGVNYEAFVVKRKSDKFAV